MATARKSRFSRPDLSKTSGIAPIAVDWFFGQSGSVAASQPESSLEQHFFFDDPIGSEWTVLGYQQSDKPKTRQEGDDLWLWDQFPDDEWWIDEVRATGAVVASSVYQPQEEWDWDEVLPTDVVPTGYLNANAVSAKPVEDAWDWDEHADDEWDTRPDMVLSVVSLIPRKEGDGEWDWDEVVFGDLVVTGYQNSDYTPPAVAGQTADHEWDWDEFGGEDGWSNHFTNYDPATGQPPEDAWDWDEFADDEWQVDEVLSANFFAPVFPQPADDAWDWSEGAEDEWDFYADQAISSPIVAQPVADAWDFDEQVDDEWLVDEYQQSVAQIPRQEGDAEWDWDEVLFSDVVSTGYQNADYTPPAIPGQPQDAEWDWDEFGGEDGWSNHYTAYDPLAQPVEVEWDWQEELDDEWWAYQEQATSTPQTLVLCLEDAWNWDEFAEDDWQEESQAVGADYLQPFPVDDAWNWDEFSEDEWQDESQPVGPDGPYIPPVVIAVGGAGGRLPRLDRGHYKYKYKLKEYELKAIEEVAKEKIDTKQEKVLKEALDSLDMKYKKAYQKAFEEIVAHLEAVKAEQEAEDELIATIIANLL